MLVWEVKKAGVVVAHGSAATAPVKQQRQRLLADGYVVIIDGKRIQR